MAVLEELLERVAEHVRLLDEMRLRWDPRDAIIVYAVLHALQVQAQAAIDYLLRACALLGLSAPTPITCIRRLEARGLLGEKDADMLVRMVRFRNIIVHEYGRVDLGRVEAVLHGERYRGVLAVLEKLHERLSRLGLADP